MSLTGEQRRKRPHVYARKDARNTILRLVFGHRSKTNENIAPNWPNYPTNSEREAIKKRIDELMALGAWPQWRQREILDAFNRHETDKRRMEG